MNQQDLSRLTRLGGRVKTFAEWMRERENDGHSESPVFSSPVVFPQKGEHPRMLVNRDSLDRIRKELDHPENRFAAQAYQKLVSFVPDGLLPKPAPGGHNVDEQVLLSIEAHAFHCLLEPSEAEAAIALNAVLNYMLTLDIQPGSLHDYCREYGHVMYTAACVYDWCYAFLSPYDRECLVSGCENLLAPYFEVGMPPVGQGCLTGHGTEAQLLRNWLALAIAAYDEYPDIYELVAGRITVDFREGQNYYLQSGSHFQGDSYGPSRYQHLLEAQILMKAVSHDRFELFQDGLRQTAYSLLHRIRPDGQALRIGDNYAERTDRYDTKVLYITVYLASVIYKDPVLKGIAKKQLKDFSEFIERDGCFTPVQFLCMNDPGILPADCTHPEETVSYNPSPNGTLICRTGWTAEDALIYMKAGESYSANHEHKDAGDFQIFFHGILASASGAYAGYGSDHDYGYYKQTISSNSLLIFNPSITSAKPLIGEGYENAKYIPHDLHMGDWVYSGGQRADEVSNKENYSLDEWKSKSTFHQAKVLGCAWSEDGVAADRAFSFGYLAVDLTNAYDEETVKKVCRSMLSWKTEDPDSPAVFAVYDHIVAQDPTYKKTFLLHVQEEPSFPDASTAIVENRRKNAHYPDCHGRLVLHALLDNSRMHFVGGPGHEFEVNGINLAPKIVNTPDSIRETGCGRIEISPVKIEADSRMLNVMTVEDADKPVSSERITELVTEQAVGFAMRGHVVLFPKEEDSFRKGIRFDACVKCKAESEKTSGEEKKQFRYMICGMPQGRWNVFREDVLLGTHEVGKTEGILQFTAPCGGIGILPADGE